ncbi:MAG: prolyl oligopeptidase family serine peptidase [Opitutaceae bacterium]|nr:prolyl oligopeptidase family serine peptidase [Opitutaceae bacterium]
MSPRLAALLPLSASLLLLLSASAASAAEDPALAYFRDLAETRNFTLGRPVSPRLTPDGKHAIFLRSAPRDPTLKLYELDLATQQERELLTPAQLLGGAAETLSAEEKARRERMRQSLKGFTAFQMSADGARLLVTLSGKLYLVARTTLKVTELPGSGWIDPQFSPDGKFVAAAGADRELHVIELSTNTARAVTSGATATLSHGTAEFVAQEEMSRPRGFWWSPDSQALIVQETEESQVEVRWVADPLHPEKAPTKFFYPRAGTPNAVVRLLVVDRAGRIPTVRVRWDDAAFPYLAGVTWSKNATPTLLVQNRPQTEQRLLALNPDTGATEELLRESDPAWLNLDDNAAGSTGERRPPLWLADGESFLWTTESRGAWQVELRDATGKLVREITPVTFGYQGLIGLDEEVGAVFVRGGPDPREAQLWRFPLQGEAAAGEGLAMTEDRGRHQATYAPVARLFLRTTDLFDGTWRTDVVSADDARVVATLRSVAEPLPRLPTTVLTRTTGEPAFDAAITRPRTFDAKKKYPVILSVYAGPTSKRVVADARSFLTDQWMADQGYVVVRLDGRGTPGRGRDWERIIKGNFIDIALADQIAGLQALARQHPELDLTRVGVSGWSFGGYFAAMAAIRRPEVFQAAVVGAPVVTWENYDTHYTERYLGLPQANPEAYRVSNVTTYAAQASRPLLLIHGLTDDNVYFQHTLQLADALYLAGKPYELLPMLGTHMVSDPLVRMRQQQRIMEFLARALSPTKTR